MSDYDIRFEEDLESLQRDLSFNQEYLEKTRIIRQILETEIELHQETLAYEATRERFRSMGGEES